jgi:ribosomal protein S18 acetylase RimI-like enzyme
MRLSLRPATPGDLEAAAALVNAAYRGQGGAAGWTTESHLLGGMRADTALLGELLERASGVFLLAFEEPGHGLVGTVHLEMRSASDCYLGMFTIDPKVQARGLGKALLSEAERHAREVFGARRMEMTVITVRHELTAWYERRGYRRTGRLVPFPRDPRWQLKVESLVMEILEKNLAPLG